MLAVAARETPAALASSVARIGPLRSAPAAASSRTSPASANSRSSSRPRCAPVAPVGGAPRTARKIASPTAIVPAPSQSRSRGRTTRADPGQRKREDQRGDLQRLHHRHRAEVERRGLHEEGGRAERPAEEPDPLPGHPPQRTPGRAGLGPQPGRAVLGVHVDGLRAPPRGPLLEVLGQRVQERGDHRESDDDGQHTYECARETVIRARVYTSHGVSREVGKICQVVGVSRADGDGAG